VYSWWVCVVSSNYITYWRHFLTFLKVTDRARLFNAPGCLVSKDASNFQWLMDAAEKRTNLFGWNWNVLVNNSEQCVIVCLLSSVNVDEAGCFTVGLGSVWHSRSHFDGSGPLPPREFWNLTFNIQPVNFSTFWQADCDRVLPQCMQYINCNVDDSTSQDFLVCSVQIWWAVQETSKWVFGLHNLHVWLSVKLNHRLNSSSYSAQYIC